MTVTVNLEKAKEIKREMLRVERAPLLEKLDVAYMKALENGEDTSSITAKKKLLRDVTKHPEIEKAEDVNILASMSLSALTNNGG